MQFKFMFLVLLALCHSLGADEMKAPDRLDQVFAPVVVGRPPTDAFHGLIRLDDGEIRHYGGNGFIYSRDNGLSWKNYRFGQEDSQGKVKRGGVAGAVSPRTGTYLRVESGREGLFVMRSTDGIDGKPDRIKIDDQRFIMIRPPLFLKSKDRVLFAGHVPTRPHQIGIFWSGDDGKTWHNTMLPAGPKFKVTLPHRQPRWENWCVEPTILELNDGRLWMIARTSQDRHHQCFSQDGGQTWSPWEPSRFYGTLTMPTLFRLGDGRILFFWCNTAPLPEADRSKEKISPTAKDGTWEDVFTNRDAFHAAISDDEGKTWRGFREVRLNPFRNAKDYGDQTKLDWSVHQAQAVELPGGKVLVSHGQDAKVRALVLFDPNWLLEEGRESAFENGLDDWSSFKYFKGIRGHCAYNRTDGCRLVPHPEDAKRQVMQIRHEMDPQLVYDRDGATWNFPAASSGTVRVRVKPLFGGKGGQVCLLDHWVNPTDPIVRCRSSYALRFDGQGKINGKSLLKVGQWNTLVFTWKDAARDVCTLQVDGAKVPVRLSLRVPARDGLSYVHFQSSPKEDAQGFLVESVEASRN